MPDPMYGEGQYVSRYSEDTLGLIINKAGIPADADGNDVLATWRPVGGTAVFARQADHLTTGQYAVTLSAGDTALPGRYELVFDYAVDAVPDIYVLPVEVGGIAPDYDALSPGFKQIVENVWIKFSDLFDSAYGGPHLQTYLQTNFGRNRLAQLLRTALGKLNTFSQPQTTYTLALGFPFDQWGPLLEQALYIEVLKHLVRSYTEQPDVILGTAVSRLDRTRYAAAWQAVLDSEIADYKDGLSNFKMAHMGLGRVSVLVAGGAFGNFGPTVSPGGAGAAAARGYFAVRYF